MTITAKTDFYPDKIYNKDGQVVFEGMLNAKGEFEGPIRSYHENGNLSLEGTLDSNGLFVGLYKKYHENGKPHIEGTYNTAHEFEGLYQKFHENGQLEFECIYDAKGDYEGIVTHGDELGNKTHFLVIKGNLKKLPDGEALAQANDFLSSGKRRMPTSLKITLERA